MADGDTMIEGSVDEAGAAAELRRRERELSDFAEELHKSRRQLETVFNNATVALFIMDERQHCTYMNRAAEKLTGYLLSEVQGRPLHYFVHHTRPDGRPYPLEECPIDRAFPRNNQAQGEEVFVHKDGSFYPVAFTASPIREGETIVGTIIEVRDIRRERQAAQEREELLERAQAARAEAERQRDFSRRVLDHAPIAIGVLEGPEHRFVLVNSQTCALTGLSAAEFIGRAHADVLPAADKVVGAILDRVYASGVGETEEIEVELPKGRRHLLVTWTALPGATGRAAAVLYMSLDITERKRAETALRESQARLRMAMDVANIYSWEMNLSTRRLEWSANVERVIGFPLPTDFAALLSLVHEADRATTARLIREAIETGGVYESEFRLVNPTSGEIVWVVGQGVLALGFDDEQPRFVGITQNITNRKRAAEALSESTEQYQATFERAAVGIGHTAPDGRWLRVNQKLCDITGYTRAELLALTYRDITHPDYVAGDAEAVRQMARGERQSYVTEKRYVRKDGSEVWVNLMVAPMRDESGALKYFISVIEDVTDRKRAEAAVRESERQLRTLADAVPQLVWMAEPDGHIFWYNQRWYDYTGTSPEQMAGWGWQSVHDPKMLPLVLERWQASLDTGEMFEMEFPLRGADGVFRWFLTRVNPLRDAEGRIVRWFGTNTDVDEQRRTAEELREANRLKDEFLATVSHELRTPLTAVLGWAHILRSGQLDEQAARDALETIERNARSQAQLIDDLLDVSRIITGKLRLDVRQIAPGSFIESAIESVRPAAEAKGVRIQQVMDTGVNTIAGDAARLQQVVWNLLSNAIKFTPKGGRVQVRLERINSHIEIAVTDTGAGISAEFLPHVFDRFRQADQTTTRHHGGLGLGLAIVRHLVELHGGTVHAESQGAGQGATFKVKLPVIPVYNRDGLVERRQPAARESLPTFGCPERLDGLKVLVVDDEADARELLRVGLGQCGAEVTTAGSMQEALAAFAALRPEILVSDIGMPDEDGYALIRKIRALPAEAGGRIPAIALTAYARAEDRLQSLRAGYQMHVVKPVEITELVAVVASLVQRYVEG